MNNPQILKTRDYGMFRSVISNREVSKAHVKRLVKSIKKKNLLHIRPMLVNGKLDIIDGQHRLTAAEILKTDIFYMICNDLTREDISILNTAQKNWTTMDFINFFTIENRPGYKEFSKLINQFPLMKLTALTYLCNNESGMDSNIRQGRINIMNINRATVVCNFISKLRNMGFDFVYERDFAKAFNRLYDHKDTIMMRAKTNPELLRKCDTEKQYHILLTNML